MTNRWRWLAILAALLGAFAGLTGSGAMTASAAGAITICNHAKDSSGNTLCLQGEGVGNQMKVASSQPAQLTEIIVSHSGGDAVAEFENPSGHCVYEDGAGDVRLQNARCGGKLYEEWVLQPSSQYSGYYNLFNVNYSHFMNIHSPNSGAFVYAGSTNGTYFNWTVN